MQILINILTTVFTMGIGVGIIKSDLKNLKDRLQTMESNCMIINNRINSRIDSILQ